jgi:hypothetical protein
MNSLHKTLSIVIVSSFISLLSWGQTDLKFYATLEDYKNNKPITGYDIQEGSWQGGMGKESFKVINTGVATKTKVNELPSALLTYGTYFIRVYDGHCYKTPIAENKLCYYELFNLSEGEFYSEGVTAEIKKYSNKVLVAYLKEYGLLETYKEDKSNKKSLETQRKYFKMISDKMK